MKILKIDLLLPEDLPVQYKLDKVRKEKVSLSLKIAFQSLNTDCHNEAIMQIDSALKILGLIDTYIPSKNFKATKKYRESLEYDNYFNVKHIKTEQPEIHLLKSILIAYRRFVLMEQKNGNQNLKNINTQRQGFKSYFQLLSRVFYLDFNYETEK